MAKSAKKQETKKEAKKEVKEEPKKVIKEEESKSGDIRNDYNPSEPTIKEMMIVKNVDRDEAIRILRNPTPHKVND